MKNLILLITHRVEKNKIIQGDALEVLKTFPDEFIDCCITSPPYWGLRDYGVEGQIGLERTPEEYVAKMVEVFREVKRVLKKEGTFWLNLGDSYWGGGFGTSPGGNEDFTERYPKQASNRGTQDYETRKKLGALKKHHSILKPKDLVGIPWRVAFALQADGWYLRQDIIWAKPNPMPESVTDRCTKSHEYIFLLTKSPRYYFDNEAIKEPASEASKERYKYRFGSPAQATRGMNETVPTGKKEHLIGITTRNKRSVWTVTTKPCKEAHFATFPPDLITPMILAGCPEKGLILDPFMGSGTVAEVAKYLGRNYLGIELNPSYIKLAENRLRQEMLL